MSLLFETIACIDGRLQNLKWHQARVNKAQKALLSNADPISLQAAIEVPGYALKGLWKCRVSYGSAISNSEFTSYAPRKIEIVKLVEANIYYAHKFNNREELNTLFESRGKADEILIVVNGEITDSSIANVVLFDGVEWITPLRPLLEGTMRAKLLEEKIIKAKPIYISDLASYQKLMFINAMNPFDESKAVALPNAIVD